MFWRYNLFAILWAIVIFLLILMPGAKMPSVEDVFSFDKLAHSGVFCILTFLLIIGFTKQSKYPKLSKSAIKHSVILSAFYGSILELGQSIVPDRYANLLDLTFNMLGILMGYALFIIIYKLSFV